jgi:hypothetical protein
MRVSANRPRRSTSTATETLSTESRFTAERRGIGSAPGSRTTSLASLRIVVVHGVVAVLINAGVCGRVPGRDSPGRDVPTGDARRTGGGDHMAADCRHPGAGRCDQSCRPRDRRNWRPRASFFLPVLGFVLVDDPGCPAATASELQLVFGGALPACCVVNGFVNETRRNCRDSVRRGAMAGMGD